MSWTEVTLRDEKPMETAKGSFLRIDMDSGDFTLTYDKAEDKAYILFERPHFQLICATLTDDFTACTGEFSVHYDGRKPPYTREAPTFFTHNGRKYLFTSGTSGYHSNRSEVAVSRLWHGPYEIQGNPHRNDKSLTSFNSQISCVFRHPGKKDLYIAMADRWMPDLPEKEGAEYATGEAWKKTEEKFRRIFDPESEFVFSPEDAKEMFINSSVSDYVWLPLTFEGERAYIDWRDDWKVEEFA